jgi:cytochrome c peroxidase
MFRLLIRIFLCLPLLSCTKERVSYVASPYKLKIPSHFPQMKIPDDNPMTVEGVALGRKLFYEKKLSLDNSISCASCHAPQSAFSDPNQFSFGVNNAQGDRNSMALINLGWQDFFFWDGRAKTLEDQILEPVPNPVEMHQSWKKTVEKLKSDVNYRNDFYKAFGEEGIDSIKVSKAIAQFLRTMISGGSKFDVMYKFENSLTLTEKEKQLFPSITPEEWAGYDLFRSLNGADCFHCHNGPMIQVQGFFNNGLDNVFTDVGREKVTNNINDKGKFKSPTLRNIELTAPYMHDGRFQTLDEVINHYSEGVKMSPSIDPNMEFANQGGVQLNPEEKYYLKLFLKTLTDYDFINNPDFQDPN